MILRDKILMDLTVLDEATGNELVISVTSGKEGNFGHRVNSDILLQTVTAPSGFSLFV